MKDATPWFALTVKPRHEKAVAQILCNKRLQPFLPLYRVRHRWTDRSKPVDLPLFPGYIFCRFEYQNRVPVLNTPGVTGVIGFGNVAAPVAEEEISGIQAILASGLPARPWPYVRVGQWVCIERGSLAGLEGVLLREKDALRVVVSVELLHRAVAVEIDREMICAVQGAAHAAVTHLYLTD